MMLDGREYQSHSGTRPSSGSTRNQVYLSDYRLPCFCKSQQRNKRVTMDALFTRLEEASHAGDVNLLRELLRKDKLLLDRVIASTSLRDNPLHIAAILGHAAFAHEVICCNPKLAKELNGQGLSPLHLAAAHGHVAVVKELLKTGFSLCLFRERHEGLLPVHVAVIKGRTVIVKVLVEACEEAMHERTNGGETILHLAVKYNSFDTVEFLIDRMHDLNAKDNKGNTILHVAMTSKQLSVTKFLLGKGTVDVNSMNLKFSTPLDVLLESRPEYGDLLIGEMIRAAGGKTAAEMLSNSEPVLGVLPASCGSNPKPPTKASPQQPHCLGTKNDTEEGTSELPKEKKASKYNTDILLLVATLVATVTFQAALNPPGGVQPDDEKHQSSKGQAVLVEDNNLSSFLIFDMFALFSSVSVILLFLCVVPRKKKIVIKFLVGVIWVAAFSMSLAFTSGIAAVYNNWEVITLLLHGWFAVLRLGISWVLVRFLFFLIKRSRLREPVWPIYARLKEECFLMWKRLRTKHNWSRRCELLKNVSCILSIICVMVVISLLWGSYKFIGY